MHAGNPPGLRAVLFLLASLVAFVVSGCGYRLQTAHGGRFTDPALRIALEPFRNQSADSDAGALMATRLREELRRNGFRGAFERSGADYLVEGRVVSISEDVATHGSEGFALEHTVVLSVDVRVVEAARGRLLWKGDRFTEGAAFFAGKDFQYTEANRRMALEEASRRLARRLGQALRMVL